MKESVLLIFLMLQLCNSAVTTCSVRYYSFKSKKETECGDVLAEREIECEETLVECWFTKPQ